MIDAFDVDNIEHVLFLVLVLEVHVNQVSDDYLVEFGTPDLVPMMNDDDDDVVVL
jgi:hypothetical protein